MKNIVGVAGFTRIIIAILKVHEDTIQHSELYIENRLFSILKIVLSAMLTVLTIKRMYFVLFSTWQAGSVRNSFPNRRLHVGLPKHFFTLRVSCAFLRNA